MGLLRGTGKKIGRVQSNDPEVFARANSAQGPVSPMSRSRFLPGKLLYVGHVCIHDQNFNNFENDTTKLPVNKAKLTGLWARNCATIQQVLLLKFDFGPEKFPGLSRNGHQTRGEYNSCFKMNQIMEKELSTRHLPSTPMEIAASFPFPTLLTGAQEYEPGSLITKRKTPVSLEPSVSFPL